MSKKNQAENQTENFATSPFQSPCFKGQVSRRAMLSQGMLTGVSYLALPSIIDLVFQRQAYGAELVCKAPAGTGVLPAFLQFELNGGWSFARNFAFGKQKNGGAFQPLAAASYATMGIGAAIAPVDATKIDMSIGGPMMLGSPFLAGLKSAMTPEALTKLSIAGIAGISNDDSANNPLNLTQLATQVANAGANQLVQIVGNGTRVGTQGRDLALPVGASPSLSTASVVRPADALNLVDPGLLASRLNPDSVKKIAGAVKGMSESQLNNFQKQSLSQQMADLVRCGYIGSQELLGGIDSSRIDPAQDPIVSALPGNPLANAVGATVASIGKLLADGMAAAGSIALGGYDYHGQGLTTQDAKDREAGVAVGIACQIAHMKGVPLFGAVTSDGSVAAAQNGQPDPTTGFIAFNSDSGERGSILLIAMNGGNPGAAGTRPQMNHNQIGAFSDAGAVDAAYLPAMATTPSLQAITIAANYAAFAGKMDVFRSILSKANQEDFIKDNVDYLAFKVKA